MPIPNALWATAGFHWKPFFDGETSAGVPFMLGLESLPSATAELVFLEEVKFSVGCSTFADQLCEKDFGISSPQVDALGCPMACTAKNMIRARSHPVQAPVARKRLF